MDKCRDHAVKKEKKERKKKKKKIRNVRVALSLYWVAHISSRMWTDKHGDIFHVCRIKNNLTWPVAYFCLCFPPWVCSSALYIQHPALVLVELVYCRVGLVFGALINSLVSWCLRRGTGFTPTETTLRNIKDEEHRTATSTFTQLLSSEGLTFSVLYCPQRLWGLLGTKSPGRPLRLSHSSWALRVSRSVYFTVYRDYALLSTEIMLYCPQRL